MCAGEDGPGGLTKGGQDNPLPPADSERCPVRNLSKQGSKEENNFCLLMSGASPCHATRIPRGSIKTGAQLIQQGQAMPCDADADADAVADGVSHLHACSWAHVRACSWAHMCACTRMHALTVWPPMAAKRCCSARSIRRAMPRRRHRASVAKYSSCRPQARALPRGQDMVWCGVVWWQEHACVHAGISCLAIPSAEHSNSSQRSAQRRAVKRRASQHGQQSLGLLCVYVCEGWSVAVWGHGWDGVPACSCMPAPAATLAPGSAHLCMRWLIQPHGKGACYGQLHARA